MSTFVFLKKKNSNTQINNGSINVTLHEHARFPQKRGQRFFIYIKVSECYAFLNICLLPEPKMSPTSC